MEKRGGKDFGNNGHSGIKAKFLDPEVLATELSAAKKAVDEVRGSGVVGRSMRPRALNKSHHR